MDIINFIKNNSDIIIILIIILLVIYLIINKKTQKIENITSDDKSKWKVNTILEPGQEIVSPNGLVKLYVKIIDNPNKNETTKWIQLWRKNPNKTGVFDYGNVVIDVGDMPLLTGEMNSKGVQLLKTGTNIGNFNIQTITINNKVYNVTYDGNAFDSNTSKNPSYYDENGVLQGKISINNSLQSSFFLKTDSIDYILVRNDAILIFDNKNKLLGVIG